MKLNATIDGKQFAIELSRNGRDVTASIDGSAITAEVSEPEPNVYLFKHHGKIYEAHVDTAAGGDFVVKVSSHELTVGISDPKRLRGSSSDAADSHGHAEIRTAMPGKVVRILKAAGDAVTKGEGVIVVEAMKMQNEMKSPRDGTITEIRVADGDTVGAGDVLVLID